MTNVEILKPLKVLAISLALVITGASTPALSTNKVIDNSINNSQVTCLADNAYFEARGQSTHGKIAVMNVVMNRVADPRFPKTPCGVIYQRSGKSCQFSWVCSGSRKVKETSVYRDIQHLASKVYAREIGDVTGGAKFFHSRSISPGWRKRPTVIIGSHVFYK